MGNASDAGSVLSRVRRWLEKPSTERNRLLVNKLKMVRAVPFLLGRADAFGLFLAYHPDSHTEFSSHPEFRSLVERFTRGNARINAGDLPRLWSFILNIKQVLAEGIPGDFAEVGVFRGNTAAVLAHFAARNHRTTCLFDTFRGFDGADLHGVDEGKRAAFADTSVDVVRRLLGEDAAACEFVVGTFPSTVNEAHRSRTFAVVSLDCDLYAPTKAALEFFFPLMPPGGLFLLHDYSNLHWEGSRKAIDEFCAVTGEHVILLPDKSGSAIIRRSRP